MPYTARKENGKYVIYKKDGGKRVGSTNGDKESLKKYLAALHMNANEGKTSKLEELISRLVREVIDENSCTGGGVAGANMNPGTGEQYGTARSFKKKKYIPQTIIIKKLWNE